MFQGQDCLSVVLWGAWCWCAVVAVTSGMNIWCAVVHGVNEIFVWCCVVRCLWCGVVHGASGMNGVRYGGCGMQKGCCGVLWWLSYINCFFCFIGAALVGRVGMISSFPASPAQLNQLKLWLNVIYEKIE